MVHHPPVLEQSSVGVERISAQWARVVARVMTSVVSQFAGCSNFFVYCLFPTIEAGAPCSSISSQIFPTDGIHVHGFHVSFCDIFISEPLATSPSLALSQLSIEEHLGYAGVVHSENVSQPSELRCGQGSLHAFQVCSPEDFDIRD